MYEFFDFIAIPMAYVVRFLNSIVGNNYIFTLFLFAIVVEILLLPLGIKQQKSSIKQARLRPQERAIRNKYKGKDAEAQRQMQMELQEFYRKEKFNPMQGCLPLLIQLPIIMALFSIVNNPLRFSCQLSTNAITQIKGIVEGYTGKTYKDTSRTIELMGEMKNIIANDGNTDAFKNVEGFTERIKDISDIPNLSFFGGKLDLSVQPWPLSWNLVILVPILTFVVYYFTMKLTKKLSYQPLSNEDQAAGCSGKFMDISMPLMSAFFAFMFPAALGVYWIFKSISALGKQALLSVAMPIPKFTDADYKAAEKHVKETTAPPRKVRQGVRSLHRIDEEEDEDTSAEIKALPKAEPKKVYEDKTDSETEKPSRFEAELKKDDRKERKKDKKKNDKDR